MATHRQPIPPPLSDVLRAHPGRVSLQAHLRRTLQQDLDIKIKCRPMQGGVQAILSTEDMMEIYERRRAHMLARAERLRECQKARPRNCRVSQEACPCDTCAMCTPSVAFAFWHCTMSQDLPFRTRMGLLSVEQRSGLRVNLLTYDPILGVGGADRVDAAKYLPRQEFDRLLGTVGLDLLSHYITVSACVQAGGWSIEADIVWLREAPHLCVLRQTNWGHFFASQATANNDAVSTKQALIHGSKFYLRQQGDNLSLGRPWAFPKGSAVGKAWLRSVENRVFAVLDAASSPSSSLSCTLMGQCVQQGGLELSIVDPGVVGRVEKCTDILDGSRVGTLKRSLCVTCEAGGLDTGGFSDRSVWAKLLTSSNVCVPVPKKRKICKCSLAELETVLKAAPQACPQSELQACPQIASQACPQIASQACPQISSESCPDMRASFLWPQVPSIVDHSSRLGLSSFAAFQSKYELLGLVGDGSYGNVYRAKKLSSPDKPLALKICRESEATTEAWFQAHCSDDSVVQILDGFMAPHYTVIVMPMADTTLHRYVVSEKSRQGLDGGLSPPTLIKLARQVSAGLAHIHKQGVAHNDVHTGNILIYGARSQGVSGLGAMWSDFGKASWLTDCDHDLRTLFSLSFRPPELLLGGGARIVTRANKLHYVHPFSEARHGAESDVWALGCVLMFMSTATLPFQSQKKSQYDEREVQQIAGLLSVLGRPSGEVIQAFRWQPMFADLALVQLCSPVGPWPRLEIIRGCLLKIFKYDLRARPSALALVQELDPAGI